MAQRFDLVLNIEQMAKVFQENAPTKGRFGGYFLNIPCVTFQTPIMHIANITTWGEMPESKTYFSFNCSELFCNWWSDLETYIKSLISKNWLSWFKGTTSSPPEFFYSMQDDFHSDASKKLKLQINTTNSGKSTLLFDNNAKHMQWPNNCNEILVGKRAVALLELSGVWFSNGKCGLKWNVSEIKLMDVDQTSLKSSSNMKFVKVKPTSNAIMTPTVQSLFVDED